MQTLSIVDEKFFYKTAKARLLEPKVGHPVKYKGLKVQVYHMPLLQKHHAQTQQNYGGTPLF
ncbi:hypothetical protein SAMN04487941_0251 [Pontibacter akesuensis]|uniref:Uncharacterized protein n=1 Tax=Pontibacter akesuensis TaxID=388950 RepID=A0A1I7FJN8_9BACT|nr:hypothetical protein GCM10007389_13070 [Pontibacter akesuensis]SFU36374.1 hypothetical protein SAMN04487941_0251 [Pontibacter akesuensis]